MPVSLEQWQARLERHFESLARKRSSSGFPIFALEHGLEQGELDEIASQLRSRLRGGIQLAPHWLLWVIYTTESGYTYTGDEYWHSFEESTPAWDFSDRDRIKPWFRKFQKAYNGVEPSGPWAEHRRIIAWPITHAVLPRYLQREFARALYDLRFRLATLSGLEPARIGRLLAANAYATTRFQEFLQQEELTGRIVLALFGAPSGDEGREPIYRKTLDRIVADLEKIRSARGWLKETQRVVSDRFKGIGHGVAPVQRPADVRERPAEQLPRPEVRPNLLLRYSGGSNWSVVIDMPDFRGVAALNAEVASFLRRTRCRLNGAPDRKPAGWLLSGSRKSVLRTWPDQAKPLLEFEQPNAYLTHLLESECRLGAGPVWLFRIGADGTALEIVGHVVRPDCDYVVVTVGDLPERHAFMSACSIDCAGVKAFKLAIPAAVGAEDTRWLHGLGLQIARTIRVWPAGMPGRNWDGEGRSEWLTTEQPCLALMHDHPVEAYALSIDRDGEQIIKAGNPGRPIYLKLPSLPVGSHLLTVRARRSGALEGIASAPPEGHLQLSVREPEPWIPGVVSHAGMLVKLDPPEASLDTFWQNKVTLSVLGPQGHSVHFALHLESRDGSEILSESIGAPMELPVTPDAWSKQFGQFVKREKVAWSLLEAAAGRLVINGETLGETSFRFEHEVPPLRWVLRNEHGNIVLRLVDETGQEGEGPEASFYDMQRPLRREPCTPEACRFGLTVQRPGGLFFARRGQHSDMVVVSTGLTAGGLQGLGVSPVCDHIGTTALTLAESCRILALWRKARLAGFLADSRCQQVKSSIVLAIFECICGSTWASAESDYRRNPTSANANDNLKRCVVDDRPPSFAVVLHRDHGTMNGNFGQASAWYAELSRRYKVCTDPGLCTFALKVASAPDRIEDGYGANLDHMLGQLVAAPAILRGARLLAALCAQEQGQSTASASLLPRWRW